MSDFKTIRDAIRAKGSCEELSKEAAEHLACRVVAGALWLDTVEGDLEYDPSDAVRQQPWWVGVDLDALNLRDCESCVLGQVVGDYRAVVADVDEGTSTSFEQMAELLLDQDLYMAERILSNVRGREREVEQHLISHNVARVLGFHLDEDHFGYDQYAALTRGWRALIEARQAEAARTYGRLIERTNGVCP